MVSALKLILDQHVGIGAGILAENVCPERPNILLGTLHLQLDTDRLAQERDVLRPGQPGRELGCLAQPGTAQLDALEPTKEWCHRHGCSLPNLPMEFTRGGRTLNKSIDDRRREDF